MSFFQDVINIVAKYYPQLLSGVGNTMLIALTGTVAGLVIGLLTGIVRTAPFSRNGFVRALHRILNAVIAVYVEIFRGTPMMVQAMVIYYGAMQYLGLDMPQMLAAVLIVSVNTGAYMAEIIRGGIISVDKGQVEAAKSIGMTHWQTMSAIVLPQAVRNIMPSIGNEFVVNIKDSSVLNVISVSELFFMSKSAAGTYYKYFEVFFITALIYLVLTFSITRLLRLIERKMDGDSSYTICGSQSDSRSVIHVPVEKEEA